jgi:hypothetical protein
MSVFEGYDAEFRALTSDISTKISEATMYADEPESRESTLRMASALLSQVDDLVKQMDIEARSSEESGERRALGKKVAAYKKTLASLRRDFDSGNDSAQRDSLMGGRSLLDGGAASGESNRFLNSQQQLMGQNDTIRRALAVAEETEGVALEITGELARNREKIEGVRDRVHETASLTGKASRLIRSMSRREYQQKVILGCVAFFLLGAIGVVLYFVIV